MHIISGIVLAALMGGKKNHKSNGSVKVPRFRMGPVRTAHAIPGRLRFQVPSLREDDAGRSLVAEKLPRIEGVESVGVSPLTGSVLIRYRQDDVDPGLLFAALVRLLDLDKEMEASCRPVLTRELRSAGESLNRAVFEKTGGLIDLWSAMMIVLAGIGIRKIVRHPAAAFPAGFTLLWWSLNLLRKQ